MKSYTCKCGKVQFFGSDFWPCSVCSDCQTNFTKKAGEPHDFVTKYDQNTGEPYYFCMRCGHCTKKEKVKKSDCPCVDEKCPLRQGQKIEEVTVQKKWLEGLIERAQKTCEAIDALPDDEVKYALKIHASSLVGYAMSAEWLIKDQP